MGQISLAGQALALHQLSTNGLITRTGSGTVAGRSLSAGGGINVQNVDGVAGNPGVQLDGQAKALNELGTNGIITRTATNTVVARSLSAGGGINVQNANGVSGNPGVQLDGQAKALNEITANGMVYRTGASTFTSIVTGGIALGNFPVFDSVPATAGAVGSPGEIAVDNTFFYVCTATNRWGRIPLASW